MLTLLDMFTLLISVVVVNCDDSPVSIVYSDPVLRLIIPLEVQCARIFGRRI